MNQKFCVHYTGVSGGLDTPRSERRCKAGVLYESVHVYVDKTKPRSLPCVQSLDKGITTCALRVFPTAEQEAESMREVGERLLLYSKVVKAGYCPHCGNQMKKERIGRCDYAMPCNHRLNEIPMEIKGVEHVS